MATYADPRIPAIQDNFKGILQSWNLCPLGVSIGFVRVVSLGVLALSLTGCVVTAPPPVGVTHALTAVHRAPPSACTVLREEPVGGVLSASLLRALRDDVAPAVERAVCSCAVPSRLEAPSELRVRADYVPSYGRFTGMGADIGPGVGDAFDWPGFEACVWSLLEGERLEQRPLTGDVLPTDAPATVLMSLRVAVR